MPWLNMKTPINSFIKRILLIFLIIAGLFYAKEFLIPLSIGALFATLCLPLCSSMEKRKMPRGLAAFVCLMVLITGIAAVISLLGWQVNELTNDFTLLKLRFVEGTNKIQKYLLDHFGISVEKQSQFVSSQQPLVTGVIQRITGSLPAIFTHFILIQVYVVFFLYYRGHIKSFLIRLSAPSQRDEVNNVIHKIASISQQYLVGLSKMIGCLWLMYGFGFSVLGIKNALFFAFLCGLLEIIPFVGNITGTSITVMMAATHGAGLSVLAGIVITYAIIQFIQGWVLEPLIVGSQVRINPLFTIIGLVIAELVWGIPGIFLAIPVIAMFKIICDHIDSLRSYGFLIGEIETRKSEAVPLRKIFGWLKKK
jgi:predicted PurR-regulated permease PerM